MIASPIIKSCLPRPIVLGLASVSSAVSSVASSCEQQPFPADSASVAEIVFDNYTRQATVSSYKELRKQTHTEKVVHLLVTMEGANQKKKRTRHACAASHLWQRRCSGHLKRRGI